MLTGIGLRNFKAFGDEMQEAPLSKITLIYGPNSGGKSSILQAFLLLKQSMDIPLNGNLPVGGEKRRLIPTGEYVDLGSFETLLHRHDQARKIGLKVAYVNNELKNIKNELRLTFEADNAGTKNSSFMSEVQYGISISDEEVFHSTSRYKDEEAVAWDVQITFRGVYQGADSVYRAEGQREFLPLLTLPELKIYRDIQQRALNEQKNELLRNLDKMQKLVEALSQEKNSIPQALISQVRENYQQELQALRQRALQRRRQLRNEMDRQIEQTKRRQRQLQRELQQVLRQLQNARQATQRQHAMMRRQNLQHELEKERRHELEQRQVLDELREKELSDEIEQEGILDKELEEELEQVSALAQARALAPELEKRIDEQEKLASEWRSELKQTEEWLQRLGSAVRRETQLAQDLGNREPDLLRTKIRQSETRSNKVTEAEKAGRTLKPDVIRASTPENSPADYEFLLRSITHLGPNRNQPERMYTVSGGYKISSGVRGENTAHILHRNEGVREKVNDWFGRFGIDYELAVDDLNTTGETVQISLFDTRTDPPVKVTIADVGFGISCILPIIVEGVASPEGSIICVEQPELHLHPRLQAELAELMVETALKDGKQWIVETHSELIQLRLSAHIAQKKIRPEDVAIIFVQPTPNGSKVLDMGIDAQGELKKDWPPEFFDEKTDAIMNILESQDNDY